jgi:hypothetical protein
MDRDYPGSFGNAGSDLDFGFRVGEKEIGL